MGEAELEEITQEADTEERRLKNLVQEGQVLPPATISIGSMTQIGAGQLHILPYRERVPGQESQMKDNPQRRHLGEDIKKPAHGGRPLVLLPSVNRPS